MSKEVPVINLAYLDGSGRKKGKLLGHKSHKKGVDVDIVYIGQRSEKERLFPYRPSLLTNGYLLNYQENGYCGDLLFDRRANLKIILALLEQKACKVEKIFVEPYIEDWLIDEAQKMGLSPDEITTISDILRFAGKDAAKHDDHMHVRFIAGTDNSK